MYRQYLRRALQNSTRTAAAASVSSTNTSSTRSLLGLRSFSDTLPKKEDQSMVGRGEKNGEVTRVLFCGPNFPASQNYTREYLAKYPFIQVDDVPLSEVPDVISNYHLCVVKDMRLDSNVLSRANRIKVVMQYGVGIEGVDIDAATKFGIKVARIPSDVTGNATSCAEMSVYLMLGLLRKQHELRVSVQQRKLGEPIGDTLFGKTVFILGYGNIGIELAKRLKPFGVRIIATKRSWPLHSNGDSSFQCFTASNGDTMHDLVDEKGSHQQIHEFAGKADIVVCCLCMNKETVGIVNKSFISSMRKGSLLVNIARGGLLDYSAVFEHLKSGHLGGLGIDVAWTEPFDPDDPILKFGNVIITPHIAGVTEHSYRSMAKVVGDVALQLHTGDSPTGIEFVN
ncbi:D-3-phosphoglycerate dehydrogenase [Linum perenne]